MWNMPELTKNADSVRTPFTIVKHLVSLLLSTVKTQKSSAKSTVILTQLCT